MLKETTVAVMALVFTIPGTELSLETRRWELGLETLR